MPKPFTPPAFLTDLLHARSPSGAEFEAQAVFDAHVRPAADLYEKDTTGNRLATLNPAGDPVLMLAGHLDVDGLDLTGLVGAEGVDRAALEIDAAENVKRVLAPASVEPDFRRIPRGVERIMQWSDVKTVWHPKGT